MALKGRKISDATGDQANRGGTVTRGHRPGGVCIAMTAIWLESIFKNKNTIGTIGDQSRRFRYNGIQGHAEALFGLYRVKGDSSDYWEARKKVFGSRDMSLDEGQQKYGTCREVFDWIRPRAVPQAYSIKVPGHALAAYVAGPKAYFYDPNEGVYEYSTSYDFFVDAYLFSFFEYCDWRNEKAEVFAWPVTHA